MKQEYQKIRSVFVKREALEKWLTDMALQGWMIKDFTYIFFDSLLFFRFEKETPNNGKFCLYDMKYEGDEEIFISMGWRCLLERESTMLFYHEDEHAQVPLLDMRMYSIRRFIKSICNLMFLVALLFALRIEDTALRQQVLFVDAFLLFALPRLYDVKSTKKGSNFTKLMKNIVLACTAALLVTLLLEAAISAFTAFG